MNIDKIQKDYISGQKYTDIQKTHNITKSKLIYLIQKNNWKRPSNRSDVQKGNKNAIGNSGGCAPKENKNAVTTGEYENIFSGCFSSAEESFLNNSEDIAKEKKLIEEYKILKIREARMLTRIQVIEKADKDMTITSKLIYEGRKYETCTRSEENKLLTIQRIEQALTKIQESIRKCVDSMHRINIDEKRLELDIVSNGEEIEDTSETDADIYGS